MTKTTKIVIAVVAVLVLLLVAGVVVVSAGASMAHGQLQQAQVKKAALDVETIRSATNVFYVSTARYPASMDELVEKQYLARALTDPWGHPYRLKLSADGKLLISSAGMDGAWDTPDDVGGPQSP
jgi:hypothetical protein